VMSIGGTAREFSFGEKGKLTTQETVNAPIRLLDGPPLATVRL
jgi:hypothetical protein